MKQDIKKMIAQNADMNRHLENLNGKVARHEKHISETCTMKHQEMDDRIKQNRCSVDEKLDKFHNEFDNKISELNRIVYKAMGVFAAIVFVVSLLMPFIIKFMEGYI